MKLAITIVLFALLCFAFIEEGEGLDLVCALGGALACEINCVTSTGHFAGKCNEDEDCICEAPSPE